jgi:hypothetical protein
MSILSVRAAAVAALVMAAASPSVAGEEVLMRQAAPFDTCPQTVEAMLEGLGADRNHVHLVSDTGAHYSVKLVSTAANLVFLCNAVTEDITITRTTPGELVTAAR